MTPTLFKIVNLAPQLPLQSATKVARNQSVIFLFTQQVNPLHLHTAVLRLFALMLLAVNSSARTL